jgi:AcrR family transcriptional regulator
MSPRRPYTAAVPRLWNQTIAAHRHDVRAAIMAATAALVHERGLRAVTMSLIAQEAGIGRATLYKYFTDVESILRTWHEQQVAVHLEELQSVAQGPADARRRLEAVLRGLALIVYRSRRHRDVELAALLHRHGPPPAGQQRIGEMLAGLLEEARQGGQVRSDIPVGELAAYSLSALDGAADLPSEAAVQRLVELVLAGLGGSK